MNAPSPQMFKDRLAEDLGNSLVEGDPAHDTRVGTS